MPDLPNPIDFAVPGFVALVLIEMLWQRRRKADAFCPADTRTSMLLGLGNSVAAILFGGLAFAAAMGLWRFRLATVPWTWWAWGLCFVLDDLSYYWVHRWGHRIRFMWASHVVHHSSRFYNLSTALRQTWTGFFGIGLLAKLPLLLAGFHPAMIAFCGAINLIYQFWIHTEAIRRFPPWVEAVMNTPSHHRVHHATNPRYLDRNYAGVFIVWDKLFGSFEPERDDEACTYGLVKQIGHFNVVKAAFHEWVAMARDVWAAQGLRQKWTAFYAPPGSLTGDSADVLRKRWEHTTELSSRA